MKKLLTTTKISQLIVLTMIFHSGFANDCQTTTLTANNTLVIPCVAVGDKFHRLTLNFLPLREISSQMYWKSGDFQEIQCQPDPDTCVTLQNQLYLKMPLKINETKYIVHLKKYPSPFTNVAYWQYRYHYQAKNFSLKSKALTNQAAYIPSQCYTKTKDAQGKVHNPCFTCHQQARIPNYNNDPDLQSSYSFAEYALTNRWHNLFRDRTQAVATISDEAILRYIRQNNWSQHNLNGLPEPQRSDEQYSTKRALQLNKAYQLIVQEQSFVAGRDATITPPQNVHRQLLDDESTGITKVLLGP